MPRALRRWTPLLAVGVLLTAAWLAASLSSPQISSLPVPDVVDASAPGAGSAEESPAPQPSGSPAAGEATSVQVPDWMTTIAGILCGAVTVVVVAVLVWYFIRDRIGVRDGRLITTQAQTQVVSTRTDVVAAVDAGLSELSQADADPRRAIIACWVRLEQAAAAAGTPRRPSDSPTDLVVRLLNTQRVSRAVLDGFAAVYREARYTTHPVDDRMRRSAQSALGHLRAELAPTSAPAGPTDGVRR